MFLTKKMEVLNIEEVNIKFDNSTKSFKINIKEDKYHVYERQYKIKRRDGNNVKKRKVIDKHKKVNDNSNDFEHLNSFTSNFNNEMNVPSVNVQDRNIKCKVLRINENTRIIIRNK